MRHVDRNKTLLRPVFSCLFLASFLLLVGEFALQSSAIAEDSPGRASFPLEADAKPAIGQIAGIKLSIPHHYMPRGVHYKGESVWKPEKTHPPRTFESEIEDFGILLRQSTYQPVQTVTDWLDYQAYFRTFPHPADNLWLLMDVFPSIYRGTNGTLRHIYDNYMKEDPHPLHWGPFIPQEGEVSGLKRAVSAKPEAERSIGEVDELLYDPTTWTTVVTCSSYHQDIPPFALRSRCKHYFTVSEIQSVAKVHFEKADLVRWSEREGEIRKVIRSFIVP
ncbi:MAG: hypothetical protein JSS26_12885 [Nitrospira sp.]|nr:hypothetical protein [Nitrospira sp.]